MEQECKAQVEFVVGNTAILLSCNGNHDNPHYHRTGLTESGVVAMWPIDLKFEKVKA